MARRSFRDRFFTPPVARAMLSPSGIVLAGAGAAVAIATGLPLLAAPVVAAAAWLGRVAVAIPRNQGERPDPFALDDPWRSFVREALEAQRRYQDVVNSARPGPLRDRLMDIGRRLEDGVDACWQTARRGQQLVEARGHLDVSQAAAQLQDVERRTGPAAERTAQALRAQLASAQRLDATINDAYTRLQVLDARLDETVARAVELSVSADDSAIADFGADVEGIVTDMEALRLALEETSARPEPGATAAGTG